MRRVLEVHIHGDSHPLEVVAPERGSRADAMIDQIMEEWRTGKSRVIDVGAAAVARHHIAYMRTSWRD